ncbi:hypothetical protein EPH_0000990 [Eimeria praecox]|uniref:Uncharacterized protein n=1 Tax=Eimeria praecox TaxID=51316 RepID=U6G5M5_9EIME|nr:hypothetical protein EPH_0000990 [Eimeria praecox]
MPKNAMGSSVDAAHKRRRDNSIVLYAPAGDARVHLSAVQRALPHLRKILVLADLMQLTPEEQLTSPLSRPALCAPERRAAAEGRLERSQGHSVFRCACRKVAVKTSWEAVATTAAGVATCHTDLPSMKRLKDWTKGVGGEFLHSAGGRGDSRLWVSMQLEREVYQTCRQHMQQQRQLPNLHPDEPKLQWQTIQ